MLAQYAAMPAMAFLPASEEIMKTWPPCLARWGRAARVRRKAAPTLVSSTSLHCSSLVSAMRPWEPMPALLTRTCRPPWASTARAIAASQSDRLRTSAAWTAARPPACSTARAVSSSSFGVRETTVTEAPAPPRATAIARPIPRPAPVTSADAPRSSIAAV